MVIGEITLPILDSAYNETDIYSSLDLYSFCRGNLVLFFLLCWYLEFITITESKMRLLHICLFL